MQRMSQAANGNKDELILNIYMLIFPPEQLRTKQQNGPITFTPCLNAAWDIRIVSPHCDRGEQMPTPNLAAILRMKVIASAIYHCAWDEGS